MDIERKTDVNENMETVAKPARLQRLIPRRLMRSEKYHARTQELVPRRPALT